MVVANIFGTDGIYVLIIALVVIFGGSQLPKLARNLGLAGKEFRKAHEEAERDNSAPAAPPAVTAGPAAAPPVSGQDDKDKISLSKSELDALLHEREARAKREASS